MVGGTAKLELGATKSRQPERQVQSGDQGPAGLEESQHKTRNTIQHKGPQSMGRTKIGGRHQQSHRASTVRPCAQNPTARDTLIPENEVLLGKWKPEATKRARQHAGSQPEGRADNHWDIIKKRSTNRRRRKRDPAPERRPKQSEQGPPGRLTLAVTTTSTTP